MEGAGSDLLCHISATDHALSPARKGGKLGVLLYHCAVLVLQISASALCGGSQLTVASLLLAYSMQITTDIISDQTYWLASYPGYYRLQYEKNRNEATYWWLGTPRGCLFIKTIRVSSRVRWRGEHRSLGKLVRGCTA